MSDGRRHPDRSSAFGRLPSTIIHPGPLPDHDSVRIAPDTSSAVAESTAFRTRRSWNAMPSSTAILAPRPPPAPPAGQGASRPAFLRPQDLRRAETGARGPPQKVLEEAKKALQDEKVAVKKHEHHLQSQQSKSDDLRGQAQRSSRRTRNTRRSRTSSPSTRATWRRPRGEILEAMVKVDEKTAAVHAAELEVKKFSRRGRRPRQADRGARRRPEGPARRARQGHRRRRVALSRKTSESGTGRTVKQRGADALRRRRGRGLLRMLRHRHPPDDERADQRRSHPPSSA